MTSCHDDASIQSCNLISKSVSDVNGQRLSGLDGVGKGDVLEVKLGIKVGLSVIRTAIQYCQNLINNFNSEISF